MFEPFCIKIIRNKTVANKLKNILMQNGIKAILSTEIEGDFAFQMLKTQDVKLFVNFSKKDQAYKILKKIS